MPNNKQTQLLLSPNAPTLSKNFLRNAIELHQSGDLKAAEIQYHQALQLNSESFESLHFLGILKAQMSESLVAIELFDKAITLNPKNEYVYLNRGLANQRAGKLQPDLEDFTKSAEIAPQYAEAYFNCGTIFQAIKDFRSAIKYFNKVIELEPNFIEAYVNNGDNFDELSDTSDSLCYYQAALKINPNSLEARYAMALSRIPKIFSTQQELVAAREIFGSMLNNLEIWVRKTYIDDDYKVVGSHEPFFLAYQDINNKGHYLHSTNGRALSQNSYTACIYSTE